MHQSADILSTRHGLRAGRIARLDARIKLILGLSAIVAVVSSARLAIPLTVLTGCLAGLAFVRAPFWPTARRLAAPLGVTLVVIVLRAFMTGVTPVLSFVVGPWPLVATVEGLWDGALIGARVLGSVSVLVLLSLTVSAADAFAALRWARVPRTWIEVAMLMHRYIFAILEHTATVASAQKIRLGYGTFRRSMAAMGSLAGIVALRSIEQAEKTHEAMTARGYCGSLPIAPLPTMSGRSRIALAAGIGLIVGAFLVAERWPL